MTLIAVTAKAGDGIGGTSRFHCKEGAGVGQTFFADSNASCKGAASGSGTVAGTPVLASVSDFGAGKAAVQEVTFDVVGSLLHG